MLLQSQCFLDHSHRCTLVELSVVELTIAVESRSKYWCTIVSVVPHVVRVVAPGEASIHLVHRARWSVWYMHRVSICLWCGLALCRTRVDAVWVRIFVIVTDHVFGPPVVHPLLAAVSILGICFARGLRCPGCADVVDHLDVFLIGVVDVLGRFCQVLVEYTAHFSHVCANPASRDKVPHHRLCCLDPFNV